MKDSSPGFLFHPGVARGLFTQRPPPSAPTRLEPLTPTHGLFFPLQHGGLRGLPHQVLRPQSQVADGAAEHDGGCGLLVPPADAAGEAEETQRLLLVRGEGREGEVCLSGEVPRQSVFGCKRGESQRADGDELLVPAGAAPGAGHLALQRAGLPLRPVRGHRAREQPGRGGLRQVHARSHLPLLQQDQNNGLGGGPCLQVPHRFCAENSKVELLEVSGESRGESRPLLENRRAHGERPGRGHGAGAGNHHKEARGAMMELIDTHGCFHVSVSCAGLNKRRDWEAAPVSLVWATSPDTGETK